MGIASALRFCAALALTACASAATISEINGVNFQSPLRNQNVSNVEGLVTAIGPNGIWIRSTTPDTDVRTSESIYVFNGAIRLNITKGDVIRLDGRVAEYRSSSAYIYLTQISNPSNVTVISRNNAVKPVVLGKAGTTPPTQDFSSLDNGDVLGFPNNVSQISVANPTLEPTKFGLDFWESLMGELVTVQKPRAVSRPNTYGDTWVVGSWKSTGRNDRGGVTMTDKGKSAVSSSSYENNSSMETSLTFYCRFQS